MTWFLALFLALHGLIHLSYVSPRPAATPGGPEWPFELASSWLLSPIGVSADVARVLGTALILAIVLGYALAALSTIGVISEGLFATGIVVGSAASIALLVLFFHPWLLLGIAIDVVLLWAVLVARWTPQSGFPG